MMMQVTAINKKVNVESVIKAFAAEIDSAGFATWIAPLQITVCENCLNLVAQNQFTADYIKREYGNVLKNVAADFLLDLNITVCAKNAFVKSANDNVVCEFKPVKSPVVNKNSFDSFIASDENMFAVAACKKIALTDASFSQLFIYGPSGSGKSMLLDCICDTTAKNVVRMSGGQFVADFARALRDKTIFSFKDFCRNCDMFIMDDVCALAGKHATSEEFLQLMMDLHAAGKSIVLTANCAPSALNGFDRRIQSLFASGLVVDVVAPNAHVRRSMLIRNGVDTVVADELSKQINADGHMVNGIINKIKTYTELMGECVNMGVASKLLGDVLNKSKTPLSMVKAMCEKMAVSFDEICGNSRARRLVRARQVMMAALKNATNLSLSEIGNVCGGRDHATVVYALSQIEKQKNTDLILNAEIEDMIKLCK
ncbi:MAG: AAA family ATPase [Alphaproteobacteria bacterium]|nr:AAA family ATPase [Alphaproteobacteria bacterium]